MAYKCNGKLCWEEDSGGFSFHFPRSEVVDGRGVIKVGGNCVY